MKQDYWFTNDWKFSGLLSRFERKNWRESYNCLIVLEHLLTHGPESVAEEFQNDKEAIVQTGNLQYIDEKGFNWGLNVRKKSERVMKLLEKGSLLKEERERARKLTRGVQGFGSFSRRTASSAQGILKESSIPSYARSNSDFNAENQENQLLEEPRSEDDSWQVTEAPGTDGLATGLKENVEPREESIADMEERYRWNCIDSSSLLLAGNKGNSENGIDEDEDHPFSNAEHRSSSSLL